MAENIFADWESEIIDALTQSKSNCFAVYSCDSKLLFANEAFHALLKGNPCESLINPSYDKIMRFENNAGLVFSGFVTIGDRNSINTSIFANIYRKHDKIMLIGGMDILSLTEQNAILHQMNAEIVHLQRELLQKTKLQDTTLTQLNIANEELTKANNDKDRFLKILAHDLKNPLFSIYGFSDLMLKNFRKYDESTIEKQLNIINSTTKKTYDLLEELLLWSRSQSGKIPIEPKAVRFTTVCNEVLSLLIENARSKSITIVCQDDADIRLYADVNMLRTILRNLITNAIKFTHPNGQITISAETAETHAIISVTDNGVGIDTSEISKLFNIAEIFTTPGTTGEKGTGLGLMLCKEFAEKQGGRIWVESEVGVGSAFRFTIPLLF